MIGKHLSIQSRLTLVIFVSFSLLLIITILAISYSDLKAVRKQTVDVANKVVNVLIQDFVRLLKHTPQPGAESSADIAADIAAKLETFSQIRQVEIYNKEHKPELTYVHNQDKYTAPVTLQPNTTLIKDDYIHLYLPVLYQYNDYGHVYLRLSADALNSRIAHYISNMKLIVPLLLLFSFLAALFAQRFFTRPIRQLAEAVNQVSTTANYSVTVTTNEKAEIGQLFDGFNRMLKSILLAQRQLHTEKERLLVTFESIAEGVITTDETGKIDYINPTACELTGWTDTEAQSRQLETVLCLADEKTRAPLTGQIDECLTQGTTRFNIDNVILISKLKKEIPVHNSIAPIRDAEQHIKGVVAVFRNVTEARELARQLEHQASHDALTDLVNRSHFERRLRNIVEHSRRNEHHAVLYLDLDQFKIVNDTCGHLAGDAMLQQLSGMIRQEMGETDLVARLGGDEFGILLPHHTIEQAKTVAEKLLKLISNFSFSWEGKIFRIGASIGVVPIQYRAMSYTDVMRHADVACYAAKNLGRNRIHLYEPSDTELSRMHSEMQWITQIENALNDNAFSLFTQRIVSTDDSNRVCRYEILLRLIERDGTIHFPGSFLPAAERFGLMPRIDRWVITHTLTDPHIIRFIERNEVEININISWATLNDDALLGFIRDLLQQSPIPASAICFEITETAAIANVPATVRFMRNMKLLGCKFALDDFGSGLSSFGYLKNLPVDYLKIDGSFIRDITTDSTNYAMVESINHIGKVMGLRTVAEYVHDRDTCDQLRRIDVDFMQGYYVHTPMPVSDLELLDSLQVLANPAGEQDKPEKTGKKNTVPAGS